jgi:hypothetical protein
VQTYIDSGQIDPKTFLDSLEISAKEVEDIDSLTKGQGEVWLTQRKGLLTSTKLQSAYTRQTTLDKDPTQNGTSTATRLLASDSAEKYETVPVQIHYGKVHENEARKPYKKYMSDTRNKLCVKSSGLVINQNYPYIAASPDDIRSCVKTEARI